MPESAERRHNSEAVMKHLVDHAEGVFLWLQLVITSLKTGITNDDSWELLWGRIDDLPVDLESFYEKLVHKLKRENKKYREFAATVFALLLLGTHYSMGSSREPDLSMDWASSIDLYFNKDLQRRLIEEKVDDPLEKNWFNVRRVCRQLRARCAGLVEADWGEEGLSDKGDTHFSFIHRTVRDFMLESGHGLWAQAVLLDLNTCLDVQHAELQCLHPGRITLVCLWAPTLMLDTEWDVGLLDWCSRIPEGFPGEPREAAFEHLARDMTAKGIWSRDERNPCVLALLSRGMDILPPRRWLEDWAPTGMSSADFKDHLLLAVLAIPKPASSVAVRWLCDNGAAPYRRGLEQWPGTNWPSAHALAIGAYAGLSQLRVLQTMMQLGVDLEEQLTVLSHDECWIIAFNRHTTSLLVWLDQSLQHKTTHYLPLMQMRIPAFLRLALGNTKLDSESVAEPDEEILMHFAKEILRHHGTIESSIQLLGFVCTDFVPIEDMRSVALLTGSYKLEHELTLPPRSPTLAAAQQALEEFHAEVEIIKQASMRDCSLPWMDSQATMDWLAASGFAEDKRDPYYLHRVGGVAPYHTEYNLDDDG
ncbi:ankyrin repeat domain-containing protein 50 [Microdochium nivale]|nr:ankyrin repeat domain-containing protein 50 [Microdochium nivale]